MQNKKQAIIFIGIPASGKSTFFKQQFADSHIRINLDMLNTRHREKKLIETCFEIGQSFVIDNTNITVEKRTTYIESSKSNGFKVIGYYFQSKIDDSINRNKTRIGKSQISELGIRGSHSKLQLPSMEEGFDELYYVQIGEDGKFIIKDWENEI